MVTSTYYCIDCIEVECDHVFFPLFLRIKQTMAFEKGVPPPPPLK